MIDKVLLGRFTRLFRHHSANMQCSASPEASAEDIYQDACVLLLEFVAQHPDLSSESEDFARLFCTHLRNRLLNQLRGRSRRAKTGSVAYLDPRAEEPSAEGVLCDKEFFARLDENLGEDLRKLLQMFLDPDVHVRHPGIFAGTYGAHRESTIMAELGWGRRKSRNTREALLQAARDFANS
jgi:DNA-directed RNA polymerase specialized sigma24 family protein